uniref:hypothetical protein n=1 Tax=Clostridium sp. 12(A) TaxID=1163671 RepID=UPI00046322C3|nr:hypothetical protein [Clostridium sp. 12(A)]
MIKDMKTINLLNYNENIVVVSTKHDSYAIEPAVDSETPTILPLNLEEILYINGNSAAFKSGILRFPEEIEQEMYEDYLRIPNWKDLLTIKEMENIILSPSMDKLLKLVRIKDIGTFDRLRGVFIRLKNSTDNDISMRIESIIKTRSDELRRGIRNTEIVIKPKDVTTSIQSEEVDALKEQNIALQKQMTKMQEMMEKMLALPSINADTINEINNDIAEVKEEPVKKPGRPKKN